LPKKEKKGGDQHQIVEGGADGAINTRLPLSISLYISTLIAVLPDQQEGKKRRFFKRENE